MCSGYDNTMFSFVRLSVTFDANVGEGYVKFVMFSSFLSFTIFYWLFWGYIWLPTATNDCLFSSGCCVLAS